MQVRAFDGLESSVEPLSWANETTDRGVTERDFSLTVAGQLVPGVAWSPEGKLSWPTILLGHGGTQHKRTAGVQSLARRLVRNMGYGAVAIDAPDHGDRRTEPQEEKFEPEEMRRIAASLTPKQARVLEDRDSAAAAEWRATVEALQASPGFSDGPFGYWGVSMGTTIGLPFVASDPRISAAVFGLAGLVARPSGARLAEAAQALRAPVLFLFQWDDELVERAEGLALFDAIGSKDKTMHVNPGGHLQTPARERDSVEAFYGRYLRLRG
jgi:dienelactone hydrolase